MFMMVRRTGLSIISCCLALSGIKQMMCMFSLLDLDRKRSISLIKIDFGPGGGGGRWKISRHEVKL